MGQRDITARDIRRAHLHGIIDFGVGDEHEPTCIVGATWFYFTGNDEYETAEEYFAEVGDAGYGQILDVIEELGFPIEEGLTERDYIKGFILDELEALGEDD